MISIVEKMGYSFNPETLVWSRMDYPGITYSDGAEIEERIATVIAQAEDVSLNSPELFKNCVDWPSHYHFNKMRANILRPFKNFLPGAEVLEIGAGCGMITRYLGESGAHVLALEGSLSRASIARSRTRDLKNVTVLAENFNDFSSEHRFDVITLIGVLEYANLFMAGENPSLVMLQRAASMLKSHGKLIIAIENQLGLKYFAGAPEDHLGKTMVGLEGRYTKKQPETFGRVVLEKMLREAGFLKYKFLAPFPDYKFPVSILTEEGIHEDHFDASAFAWQSVKNDPQLPPSCHFSLELAWPQIFKNKLALDLANSFLVVASPEKNSLFNKSILACHYGQGRVAKYSKETIFKKEASGEIIINYNSLDNRFSKEKEQEDQQFLKFTIPTAEKYTIGESLSLEFIKILKSDSWSFEDIGQFIKKYLLFLNQFIPLEGGSIEITSSYTKLPGNFFDAIPQNIIIQDRKTPVLIDQKEWNITEEIEVGYLLFRFLFLDSKSINIASCISTEAKITFSQFIVFSFQAAGFNLQEADLDRYVAFESKIQEAVSLQSQEKILEWSKQHLNSLI